MTKSILVALLACALAAPAAAQADTYIVRVQKGEKASVVGKLRARGLHGTAMRRLPFVVVTGVARAPRVRGIKRAFRDRPLRFDNARSGPLSYGTAEARAAHWAAGYDGRGQAVAVIDTGLDGTHPAFAQDGRTVRNLRVLGDYEGTRFAPPTVLECPAICDFDDNGHGTHVAGIAAGGGSKYPGIGPRADLIALGVSAGASIVSAVSALDWILANPGNVAAVNMSWGQPQDDTTGSAGQGRFDAAHPVNVATRMLAAKGIAPVFSAGNYGVGSNGTRPGASRCDHERGADGEYVGVCRFSVYGSAPWAFAAAAARTDAEGGPEAQHIGFSSSRGDTVTRTTPGGLEVLYQATVAAPGVNVLSARAKGMVLDCAGGDPACLDDPDPDYAMLSGTSMAAPHLSGAIAVVQGAAADILGRRLTMDELRGVLTRSATRMTAVDGLWDFPFCGGPIPLGCGASEKSNPAQRGYSGDPYEPYHVGAGFLNVAGAIDGVRALRPVRICHRERNRKYTAMTVSPAEADRHARDHAGDIVPAPAGGCPKR